MTEHEINSRNKKAHAMAECLALVGIPVENARRMTDHEWGIVASAAKVDPPHSQATKDAVYHALTAMYAPVATVRPVLVASQSAGAQLAHARWAKASESDRDRLRTLRNKPTACPKCGFGCASARAARKHCGKSVTITEGAT